MPLRSKNSKHRFWYVSKRGRAAYLILCLEEVLKHYQENLYRWEWLLKEYWKITETNDIDLWVLRICDSSPENVIPYISYQERIMSVEKRQVRNFCALSEDDFNCVHKLYQTRKSYFPVISGVMDKIYDVITLDWGDLETPYTPDCLSAIDEAEEILMSNCIHLPSNKAAMDFILHSKDKHYGKPFDGMRFSALNM